MAIDLKKFINRFVEESRSNIDKCNESLSLLAETPGDKDLISGLFRAVHTIKGTSRMLKLVEITNVAHILEDVLDMMRNDRLTANDHIIHTIQNTIDAITNQIDEVATHGKATAAPESIVVALEAIKSEEAGSTQLPEDHPKQEREQAVSPSANTADSTDQTDQREDGAGETKAATLKSSDMVRIQRSKLDELIKLMGEVVSSHGILYERLKDVRNIELGLKSKSIDSFQALKNFEQIFKNNVLSQQSLMEELHGKALILRMLPISIVFDPAARLVRETSAALGKKVTCKVVGSDIELDRQIIDRLGDPIVHLIRNAVDHGLESNEERTKSNKPAMGQVTLQAEQDGNWILVEISDDGRGIALEAVKQKALKKDIRTQEELDTMSDQQISNLIFAPGFSTAAMITDISGRGVGLDVVKRTIVDDMQGRIDVVSESGKGTTFQLRLPLSLAVMRVLMVDLEGKTFGFPAQNIYSLIQIPAENVLLIAERRAIAFHNEFIPLFGLGSLLNRAETKLPETGMVQVIVLQVQNEKLALVVDFFSDERDLIIKPLPPQLHALAMVSGLVSTNSGELVSLLHAPTLLDKAAKLGRDKPRLLSKAEETETNGVTSRAHILVVDDSYNTREIEQSVLEAHGYQVTLAEDGQDGLNKAMKGQFDAILTDVEMPIMDGFSLTKALRDTEQYAYHPIIIITSRATESDKRRGMEAGADAYIVKGDFEQNSLINTLETLLN